MSEVSRYTVRLMTAAKRDLAEDKKLMRLKYGLVETRRMLERIEAGLRMLETTPHGPLIEDTYLRTRGYRGLVVDKSNKIAFYVVFEKRKLVQVRRILDTRQDYLTILKTDHRQHLR